MVKLQHLYYYEAKFQAPPQIFDHIFTSMVLLDDNLRLLSTSCCSITITVAHRVYRNKVLRRSHKPVVSGCRTWPPATGRSGEPSFAWRRARNRRRCSVCPARSRRTRRPARTGRTSWRTRSNRSS